MITTVGSANIYLLNRIDTIKSEEKRKNKSPYDNS